MLMNTALAVDIIKDDLSLQIVNLEIDDTIIERNIKRALMWAASYYTEPTYVTIDVNLTTASGGYVNLIDIDEVDGKPNVQSIVAVYPVSNMYRADAALLGVGTFYINMGLALDNQLQTYANMINKMSLLESILGRNAKLVGDKLYVDQYYPQVTVAYIPSVLKIENITDGEWLTWILEYATALSKRQLAQSRGKFVVASNPSTTNASTLLEEANKTFDELNAKIATKGILIATRY